LQLIKSLREQVSKKEDTDFNTKISDIQTKINKEFRYIESHKDNLIGHVARLRAQINTFETQARQYSNYSKEVSDKVKEISDSYRIITMQEVSDNGVESAKSEMESALSSAKSEMKSFLEVIVNNALPLQEDVKKQYDQLKSRYALLEKEVGNLEIKNKKQLESKLREAKDIIDKKDTYLSKVKNQETYEMATKKIATANDALDILEERIAKAKEKIEQKQKESEEKLEQKEKGLDLQGINKLLISIDLLISKVEAQVEDETKKQYFLDKLNSIRKGLTKAALEENEKEVEELISSLSIIEKEFRDYIKKKKEEKKAEDPTQLKNQCEKISEKIRDIINKQVEEEDRQKFLDKLDEIDKLVADISTVEDSKEQLTKLGILSSEIQSHIKQKNNERMEEKKKEVRDKLGVLETLYKENKEEFEITGFGYKKQYYSNFIKNTKSSINKASGMGILESIEKNIEKQTGYLKKDLEEVRAGTSKLDDFLVYLETEREFFNNWSKELTDKFAIVKVYFPLGITSQQEINDQFKDFKKEAQEAISSNNPEGLVKIQPKIERIRKEMQEQEKEGNSLYYAAYGELALKDFNKEIESLTKSKIGLKAKEEHAEKIKKILNINTRNIKTEEELNSFKEELKNLLQSIKDYKVALSGGDLSQKEIEEHKERLTSGLELLITAWQDRNNSLPEGAEKIVPEFTDWAKDIREEINSLKTVKEVIEIQKKIAKMDKKIRGQATKYKKGEEGSSRSMQKVWEDFKYRSETELSNLESKGMDVKDLRKSYDKFIKDTEQSIKDKKIVTTNDLKKRIKEFEEGIDNPMYWVKEAMDYAKTYLSRIEQDVRYIVSEDMYKEYEEKALLVTSENKFNKFKEDIQQFGANIRKQDNNVENIVVEERKKLIKFLHEELDGVRKEIEIKRREEWIKPYISDLNHESSKINSFQERMELKINNLTIPQILAGEKVPVGYDENNPNSELQEHKRRSTLKVKKRYILGSIGNIYLYRQEISDFVKTEYNILDAMYPYSTEGEKTREYLDLVILQIDEVDNMLKAVVFETRDAKYQKYLSGVLTSIPTKYRAKVSELYPQLEELNGPVKINWAVKRGKKIRDEADKLLEKMMEDLKEGKIDPEWDKEIGTVPPYVKARFNKTRIRYSNEETPDYKIYPLETTILSRYTVGKISDPREASEVGMMVEVEIPVNPITKQPYYEEEVIESIFKDASQQAWHELSEEHPVPEYDGEYQCEILDRAGKYDYTAKQNITHQMFVDREDTRKQIKEFSKDLPDNKKIYTYGKDHVISHKELLKIIKTVNERRAKKTEEMEAQEDEIRELVDTINNQAEKYKITTEEKKVGTGVTYDKKDGYTWSTKSIIVDARVKDWNPNPQIPKVELDEETLLAVEMGDLPRVFTKWIKEEKSITNRHDKEIAAALAEAEYITSKITEKLESSDNASQFEKKNIRDVDDAIKNIAGKLSIYQRELRKFREEQNVSNNYGVGTGGFGSQGEY
jgi:hypothetical protein